MSHVLNRKGMAAGTDPRYTNVKVDGRIAAEPSRAAPSWGAPDMRMSEEKSRRLMAMVWRERAKRWALIALALAVLFGGATYMLSGQLSRADRTVEVATHTGTVTGITRAGPRSAVAHVHLDDGRDVDALSQMSIIPPAGAHVVVGESRHASGRLSYDIKGLSE